jgi:hypothetical protein
MKPNQRVVAGELKQIGRQSANPNRRAAIALKNEARAVRFDRANAITADKRTTFGRAEQVRVDNPARSPSGSTSMFNDLNKPKPTFGQIPLNSISGLRSTSGPMWTEPLIVAM